MKFTASRLSEGNSMFPAQIEIQDSGLSVKLPGFFSGKNTFLPFVNISSVSVDSPMIGYSTISFSAQGVRVAVHGFTVDEVEQIKQAIDQGQSQSSPNAFQQFVEQDENETEAVKLERIKLERELIADEKRLQRYRDPKSIGNIKFGKTPDDIIAEFDLLATNAKSLLENPKYNTNYAVVVAALISKMPEAIKKLERLGGQDSHEFKQELDRLVRKKKSKDRTVLIQRWAKYIIPMVLWTIAIKMFTVRHIKWGWAISMALFTVVVSIYSLFKMMDTDDEVED
ncbi:MAG: hypothetical protein JST69_11555 [Bacteroidetes bacterium]|nr:hypothetical protein [Bacteroidota bacterium]